MAISEPRLTARNRGLPSDRPGGNPNYKPQPSRTNPNGGSTGGESGKTSIPYLRYPYDAILESTDYMRFSVIKYVPPGLAAAAGSFNVTSSYDKTRKREHDKAVAHIDLPMPLALVDSNNVSWSEGNMNSIAAIVGSFAQDLMNSDGSFNQNAMTAFSNLTQRFSRANMGGMVQLGQDALVSLMINMIPGAELSLGDAIARNRGLVINPNTEFLFRGPQLRKFNFAFTFVARSQKESEEIKQIIRSFKKYMAPKKNTTSGGAQGAFLQAPDIFKIRYMTGRNEHQFLNKFKYCALQNVTVNYSNGSGYMSYEDGTPIVTTMVLAFNELTPIYSEDYDAEGGLGGVGF